MPSMMSCLGGCSAIAYGTSEADRAYLASHFNRWALFRGYLSLMSLAVSVPRGALCALLLRTMLTQTLYSLRYRCILL